MLPILFYVAAQLYLNHDFLTQTHFDAAIRKTRGMSPFPSYKTKLLFCNAILILGAVVSLSAEDHRHILVAVTAMWCSTLLCTWWRIHYIYAIIRPQIKHFNLKNVEVSIWPIVLHAACSTLLVGIIIYRFWLQPL